MDPAEILLISQLATLAVQGVTALIAARQNLTSASTATEQANIAAAHTNFAAVIAAATAALSAAPSTPIA